jgi:uncharacterized protein YdhG (YjbR/CyaY superfamily)
MPKPVTVDEYILSFPKDIQEKLEQIRQLIKEVAPEAIEVISYGMPGYKLKGMLVWFAAHTNHIGFYPKASPMEVFLDELADYKCSKGAIQFPFNKPLPFDLITRILQFRINENLKLSALKKK